MFWVCTNLGRSLLRKFLMFLVTNDKIMALDISETHK